MSNTDNKPCLSLEDFRRQVRRVNPQVAIKETGYYPEDDATKVLIYPPGLVIEEIGTDHALNPLYRLTISMQEAEGPDLAVLEERLYRYAVDDEKLIEPPTPKPVLPSFFQQYRERIDRVAKLAAESVFDVATPDFIPDVEDAWEFITTQVLPETDPGLLRLLPSRMTQSFARDFARHLAAMYEQRSRTALTAAYGRPSDLPF